MDMLVKIILELVLIEYNTCIYIKFCDYCVEKFCLTSSKPAIFRLVFTEIVMKNPNIISMRTSSYKMNLNMVMI